MANSNCVSRIYPSGLYRQIAYTQHVPFIFTKTRVKGNKDTSTQVQYPLTRNKLLFVVKKRTMFVGVLLVNVFIYYCVPGAYRG